MPRSQPREPGPGRADDDGIPAADPGPGAPEAAEQFGVAGEEPDRLPPDAPGAHADPPDDPPAGDDLPFRTADPRETGGPAPGTAAT